MTTHNSHTNGNGSQSQPPTSEPAPANLLRYGDETGHDPAMQWIGRTRLDDRQAEDHLDRMIRMHDRRYP